MGINFWSIILIASASQCIFLMLMFTARKLANRTALALILLLLLVILLINISNLWYAGYLYRSYPGYAGFARGMILLLGPLFYLYTLSILKSSYRFTWKSALHFIPYLVVFLLVFGSDGNYDREAGIRLLDGFMEGKLPVTPFSILRFCFYVMHLLVYFILARHTMNRSLAETETTYLIPTEKRIRWLKQISMALVLQLFVLTTVIIYMITTGYNSAEGNFFLTIILSVIVYMIAYQAIINTEKVVPDFNTKYGSLNSSNADLEALTDKIRVLFDQEKVFTDSDLTLKSLASRLDTTPHLLSSAINQNMQKSFFELIRQYRVQEFIKRAQDPKNANLSIMGIAFEVGYNSKSSFNTAFKKEMGTTPSIYLEEIQ